MQMQYAQVGVTSTTLCANFVLCWHIFVKYMQSRVTCQELLAREAQLLADNASIADS